jgi:hypothetical protein
VGYAITLTVTKQCRITMHYSRQNEKRVYVCKLLACSVRTCKNLSYNIMGYLI